MKRYEVRKVGENEWQKETEKIVMENLAESFDPVTPVITKILSGEEIRTSHEVYRYKPK
jgi:hypothetical protein